ncbi:uncharacterized protein Bfra_008018 [Botrytis fragariae]|uniref:Uncharacterized protein n=1 Tax=Botrytis fragariae TaxID=1964551 RepID=A0A8H6EGY9_9HELO|nr:uncharacterized protein Bfra_008018 [Botrytis fragariae]KAF5871500.1 hypothetical protein Bfra_008018 [Botrytis fragariae]
MAKKRQPSSAPKKASWSIESECALFGLLDFCVKHAHVFPFNEENVAGRLCSTSDSNESYTWDQITRKLEYIWREFGKIDSLSKADIYVHGSACFNYFTEDEQRVVDLNVEQWEKTLKPISVIEKTLVDTINRNESRATLLSNERRSHTSDYSISESGHHTPRAQRHQTREISKRLKREWNAPRSQSEEEGPRKRSRNSEKNLLHNEQGHSMHNEEGKRVIQDRKDKTERVPKEVLELVGDELSPSTENEKGSSGLALPSPEDSELHELTPFGLRKKSHQSQEDLVSSPATHERTHRATLRKKDEKILELQEEVNAKEDKLNVLQTKLDSYRLVEERHQEGNDSIRLLVSNLHQEIEHLKAAKDSCRRIGTFTKLAGRHTQSREEMQIERKIPIMRRLTKNILGGCDDDATLKIPDSNVSAGLSALFSFGFGLADQTCISKEQVIALISNRPPYSVIETLVEAAVCTWVFESSFPNFDQNPKSLSLLTTYRNIIATQDGAIALKNLELASHYELINHPRFHILMIKEAEDLADSLSQTIAPLFPKNPEESEENVFETWGEEKSVWKARRQQLIALFRHALEIKAHAVLTPERYELVNYVPGTMFNPQTMDVEMIETPTKSPSKEGHIVEHCLHVAIQAFTEEAVKDTDPVSQATIQYKKFTRKLTAEPLKKIGLEPVILAKAIVVLKN